MSSPQPIETARKEPHAFLLLFDLDWYIGWWHMKQGWQTHGPYGVKEINPTHWMLMPDRPS